MDMLTVADVAAQARGFQHVEVLQGASYRDVSTVVLIPTRGMIHHRTAAAINGLIAPMNQKRAVIFCAGDEVGVAYNRMIRTVLENPELSRWKYVLTIEDDNLVPADAHVRLLESIDGYDAVSGLYWTKGDVQMPMAYGDPDEYMRTGVMDFRPRNVAQALAAGTLMPVNGIAMGCALWRMDLFRELAEPWFVTVADLIPEKGPMAFTQDLHFCERARKVGKRFAVDMRVKVGHMDVSTGVVY